MQFSFIPTYKYAEKIMHCRLRLSIDILFSIVSSGFKKKLQTYILTKYIVNKIFIKIFINHFATINWYLATYYSEYFHSFNIILQCMNSDEHIDERISILIHSLSEYEFIISICAQLLHSKTWYIKWHLTVTVCFKQEHKEIVSNYSIGR